MSTPGFTAEQRLALGRYVRWVGDKLGLRDWRFELQYAPPPIAEALAMVSPVYGRKVASIWFCRDFAEHPIAEQRQIIVHELVHCIVDNVYSPMENTLPKLLGTAAWAILWEATRERSEFMVDQLADAIAPFMPEIDWTDHEPEKDGEPARYVWQATSTGPAEPEA